jgi:hypothetical protein
VTGLLLTAALLAALLASGWRMLRRRRLEGELAVLPGGSRATAIPVEDFTAIDAHVSRRGCRCGGRLKACGERSEPDGQRVLRVALVECNNCERRGEVWFDASRAYH